MIPVACKPVRAPRGFTMLELMISLVLVAVGLLGFASLQLSSMQRIEQAKASQMSNELLRELSEQVSSMSELVQKKPALFVFNNLETGHRPTCSGNTDTHCQTVVGVLASWFEKVEANAPSPRFSLAYDIGSSTNSGIYRGRLMEINLVWDASLTGSGANLTACQPTAGADYSQTSSFHQCNTLRFWVR